MSETSLRASEHAPTTQAVWRTPTFVAALVATVAGIAAGVVLTDGASESGDLSAYDPAVTASFVAARSEVGTVVARGLTFFGSTAALLPLTLALVLLFLVRRRWVAAAVVAAGMSLSLTLTVLLKNSIGRIRPPAADVLGAINNGFAFPSGHTLNGTVFFGLVTGVVLTQCHRRTTRIAAIASGVLMALGIGLSRVYLGYHWLTDVVAAWSLAVGVLGIVMLGRILLDTPRRASARD